MGHNKNHSFTGTSDHDFTGLVSGQSIIFNGTNIISTGSTSTSGNLWSASTGSDSIIANNGSGNVASGSSATIAGGNNNRAGGQYSFVGAGYSNRSNGDSTFVGAGLNNTVSGPYSSVVGGQDNLASAAYSFIGGGRLNSAMTIYATVVGGQSNTASGTHSFVLGGSFNTATTTNSFVLGGYGAISSGNQSLAHGSNSISSGYASIALGTYARAFEDIGISIGYYLRSYGQGSTTIGANSQAISEYATSIGRNNIASGTSSTAIGVQAFAYANFSTSIGRNNRAFASDSLATGLSTRAYGTMSVTMGSSSKTYGNASIAVGTSPIARGASSQAFGNRTIASGNTSHASGYGFNPTNKLVAGGIASFVHQKQTNGTGYIGAFGNYSTVLGGVDNNIEPLSHASTIFGGYRNSIPTGSLSSSVVGGSGNTASGNYSSVIGGQNNLTSGNHSIALGGTNLTNSVDNSVMVPNLTVDGDFSGGTGGSVIYSAGTDLYGIFGTGGGETLAQTLAAGDSTGANNIILTSGQVIRSSTGDGTLNLDSSFGPDGTWSITSDNDAYGSGSTWVYGQPGNGSQLAYQKDSGEAIGFGAYSTDVSSPLVTNAKEVVIIDNETVNKNSGNMDKRAVFIGARNGGMDAGVVNSVVVGGTNVSATQNNSLYTQNARLAENSGVIYSAGTDLYNIFLTETPKQNVASESNASGSINTTMTESAYPHDTIISINPSTALNTVRYTLPAPTAGLKYTFVLNASAAASVTVSVGYTTDVLGGFIHTSTLDGLRSDTGIGRVQLDAASGVFYDKFEFTSDGSKWYYVVYHNGAATDITITSNS